MILLSRSLHFIDNISEWSGKIISVLIYGILLTLIYEIIARYAFGAPTNWAHESSAFCFGAYFMLGAAYCFYREGMISVDVVFRRLPKRTQAILNVITFVFFLGVCFILIWYGGIAAADSWRAEEHSNTVWMPPLYHARTIIPVAASLLLLQGIAKLIRDASVAFTGKEPGEK